LYLSANTIVNFKADAIKKGCQLKILDLSANRLSIIPNCLKNAQSLEYLNLADNKLNRIPKSIYKIKGLKVVDLSGNPIEQDKIDRLRERCADLQVIF
ncbi:MAG: leucine-rich repeat domain-containing protein, partial [Flavobacteriales bacterium]|nr:leucine-rich repeat domain-containing protein [Flavobacteriales bacterium]